jgi:hypothetical protein
MYDQMLDSTRNPVFVRAVQAADGSEFAGRRLVETAVCRGAASSSRAPLMAGSVWGSVTGSICSGSKPMLIHLLIVLLLDVASTTKTPAGALRGPRLSAVSQLRRAHVVNVVDDHPVCQLDLGPPPRIVSLPILPAGLLPDLTANHHRAEMPKRAE